MNKTLNNKRIRDEIRDVLTDKQESVTRKHEANSIWNKAYIDAVNRDLRQQEYDFIYNTSNLKERIIEHYKQSL